MVNMERSLGGELLPFESDPEKQRQEILRRKQLVDEQIVRAAQLNALPDSIASVGQVAEKIGTHRGEATLTAYEYQEGRFGVEINADGSMKIGLSTIRMNEGTMCYEISFSPNGDVTFTVSEQEKNSMESREIVTHELRADNNPQAFTRPHYEQILKLLDTLISHQHVMSGLRDQVSSRMIDRYRDDPRWIHRDHSFLDWLGN